MAHGLHLADKGLAPGRLGSATLLFVFVLIGGCATAVERADGMAAEAGFGRAVMQGAAYRHVVYERAGGGRAVTLHVYVEGDGTPWRTRHAIAEDPTPHRPLMLQLMALDTGPSVYVGRPCYFGLAADAACGPDVWTYDRYSPQVVESMAAVIERMQQRYGASTVVLMGHSGGGALAMLLAQRIDSVRAVVTLAGNLDVAAWARHHGYTPLAGSLDPARQPPLPGHVFQWHLAGGNDSVVPPTLVAAFAARDNARLDVFAHADHRCCWLELWPRVLDVLNAMPPAPPAMALHRSFHDMPSP